jgi:CubicO group peptidase (beta-lactamase class C family)
MARMMPLIIENDKDARCTHLAATAPSNLTEILERALQASRMRGIVVAVARGDGPGRSYCLGSDRSGCYITSDSLYPVASITKMATALAVLRLVDDGGLWLDDPLAYHLSDAAAAAHLDVTVRRLLSHSAGLPMDVAPSAAPYEQGLDWPALLAACLQTPLQRGPGSRVQYSNVGYGLLAGIVERQTGLDFPEALRSLVLEPLGIEGYLGSEPPRAPILVEGVTGKRAGTPLEPFNSPFWRSLGLPWAGLVTTAEGALAVVRAYDGVGPGLLSDNVRTEAVRNQVGDLRGGFVKPFLWERSEWGLGPELRGEKRPHWAPQEASPGSFGHSGASGCVAWSDPSAGVSWAILGTRAAGSGWLVRQAPAIGAALLAGLS